VTDNKRRVNALVNESKRPLVSKTARVDAVGQKDVVIDAILVTPLIAEKPCMLALSVADEAVDRETVIERVPGGPSVRTSAKIATCMVKC
jgi:hypothetical protein